MPSPGGPSPEAVIATQFSLPYLLALKPHEWPIVPVIYEKDINHPDILATARKVSIGIDPEAEKAYLGVDNTPRERRATVIIEIKDGKVFSRMVKFGRGGKSQRISVGELRTKFTGLI
jgi:2-methylcitrate dehydratase PrpD